MNVWKQVHNYKMFRKLVISYSVFVLTTVILLACILSYFFTQTATRSIEENLKTMLVQESYASDILNEQLVSVSGQLILDQDVNNYIGMSGESSCTQKVTVFKTLSKLYAIQANFPFIESIGIYNFKGKSYIDTKNIPIDVDKLVANTSSLMLDYPRTASVLTNDGIVNKNLLTFAFNSNIQLHNLPQFAVVINVNPDYILNTINGIRGNQQASNIFVIDSKGNVVSAYEKSAFNRDLSKIDYIKRILKSDNLSGNFILTENGQRNDVTFVRSSNLGLYFISNQPYNQIVADITNLRLFIMLVSVLICVIGVIIALGVSGYIYNPIRHLIEKITKPDEMATGTGMDEYAVLNQSIENFQKIQKSAESFLNASALELQQNYLLALLKGVEYPNNSESVSLFMKKIKGPLFCVVLFTIDRYEKKRNEEGMDFGELRAEICTLADKAFPDLAVGNAIVTEENSVAILLQSKTAEVDNLKETIQHIQQHLIEEGKCSVSAAVGNYVREEELIAASYKSAVEYMKNGIFCETNCIIDSVAIQQMTARNIQYPYEQSKLLMEAIQSGDLVNIREKIRNFVAKIREAPYYQLIAYCDQLVVTVCKFYKKTGILDNEQADTIFRLDQCASIEDVLPTLELFIDRVCTQLRIANNRANDKNHRDIVEKAQSYILEHYCDQNLSLELIADKIGISAGYLGKLFKLVTHGTFNDYLNTVRMERASNLLRRTNEPVWKICEMVGICSVTYFSTLFRKTFSISPTKFRELEQLHPAKDKD